MTALLLALCCFATTANTGDGSKAPQEAPEAKVFYSEEYRVSDLVLMPQILDSGKLGWTQFYDPLLISIDRHSRMHNWRTELKDKPTSYSQNASIVVVATKRGHDQVRNLIVQMRVRNLASIAGHLERDFSRADE